MYTSNFLKHSFDHVSPSVVPTSKIKLVHRLNIYLFLLLCYPAMWNASLSPSPSAQFLILLQGSNDTPMRAHIIPLESTLFSSFSELCQCLIYNVVGNQSSSGMPPHASSHGKWFALLQINSAFLSWEYVCMLALQSEVLSTLSFT